MGLDWVLKTKVKEGHHADHAQARERLMAARETIDVAWSAWLAEQKADGADVQYDRFRAEHGDLFAPLLRLEDELDRHEVNPMALLEAPRVGIDPEVTEYLREENSASFRGKVIGYAQDVIGERLAERAYTDMEPDDMLDYADELEAAVADWVGKQPTLAAWLKMTRAELQELEHPPISPLFWEAWNVLRGAEWLRFWADHEFSVHAWF